jgi:hypothetical protein
MITRDDSSDQGKNRGRTQGTFSNSARHESYLHQQIAANRRCLSFRPYATRVGEGGERCEISVRPFTMLYRREKRLASPVTRVTTRRRVVGRWEQFLATSVASLCIEGNLGVKAAGVKGTRAPQTLGQGDKTLVPARDARSSRGRWGECGCYGYESLYREHRTEPTEP